MHPAARFIELTHDPSAGNIKLFIQTPSRRSHDSFRLLKLTRVKSQKYLSLLSITFKGSPVERQLSTELLFRNLVALKQAASDQ